MTLWLTRLIPNLDHRDALTDLADVTRLHRRLMILFPDSLGTSARSAAGLLFRVETAANSICILLQSSIQPDLGRLPHRYGHAETTQLDSFLQMLTNGMTVRYRITANPSKQLPRGYSGPGHPGQRVALRGTQAEAWWRKRADQVGLTLTSLVMLPRQDLVGHQTGQISKAGNREIRHAAAQYDGAAIIRDVDTVRGAMSNGIGRGKPYGCGLLSLAPIHRGQPANVQ
jgi:CRISPR system Cascade subunit CasE